MSDDGAPPEWGPTAVLRRLAAKSGETATVSTQLFLGEQVPEEDIARFVSEAASKAAAELGIPPGKVRIGKPFKLARSIAMTAPWPVIDALMAREEFVDILPADVGDAMMKPVRRDS